MPESKNLNEGKVFYSFLLQLKKPQNTWIMNYRKILLMQSYAQIYGIETGISMNGLGGRPPLMAIQSIQLNVLTVLLESITVLCHYV